ncbi:MAG: cysteine hydrolase family protein [Desulfomonilaceae bacterium]
MDTYTRPDWLRSVLLTIDVQRDFTIPGAPAFIPGTVAVIPAIERLLDAYRCARLPIIHVTRLYLADGSNVDFCRRERVEAGASIVAPGAEGSQIVTELLPSAIDPSRCGKSTLRRTPGYRRSRMDNLQAEMGRILRNPIGDKIIND